MRILFHVLRAETLTIEQQLHFIQIRVHPDRDFLPLHPRPIPVREEMQNRLVGPPRLVVEKRILRETAGIDNSILRASLPGGISRSSPRLSRRKSLRSWLNV
jgi:hypothetical protein